MEEGHTLHLVKGGKTAAAKPAATTSATTTTTTTGTGSTTGAAPAPAFPGFPMATGPPGTLAPNASGANIGQVMDMMNNPMVQGMLQNMFQNPAMMEMVINSNPMLK